MAWLIVLLFCFVSICSAQIADTLNEVNIKAHKKVTTSPDIRVNDFSPGQKITVLDSNILKRYESQSVGSLLAQQVPVFIRSYGLNGLATLNFRGSSAAQTQVYWDGIPINNAALGLTDVNTLPVSLINKVNVVYGGSAALLGSGNVGGALMLNMDTPIFDSTGSIHYHISGSAGSFHQYTSGGNLSLSQRKWFLSTGLYYQNSKNDYNYKNDLGKERVNEHADLKGVTAKAQLAYKINDYNLLKLNAWYQRYDREIPPALFEQISAKKRDDRSLKIALSWDGHFRRENLFYIRSAFIRDQLHYEDSISQQLTDNHTIQWYGEAGWNKSWNSRHQLMLFIPVQVAIMPHDTLISRQEKYAIALAYTYTGIDQRLNVSACVRNEQINGRNIFLPGLNISYLLADWIKIRGNIQKTYRAPTLNELYFIPGGNEQLKPESGWAEELGYHIQFAPASRFRVQHDIALFNREIKDWIVWYGGAIWTPHNIAKVQSRGVEAEYLLAYDWREWHFMFGMNGTYVAATTVSSYLQQDGTIGKQIPYTPKWIMQVNTGIYIRSFSLNLNYTYNGYRYMNADESGILPAYNTMNIHTAYTFSLKKKSLQFFLQGNNIFNERYAVIASRIMPGVNWLAGVVLSH